MRAKPRQTAPLPLVTYTERNSTYYGLGPTDFATIYNVLPLWNAGIDGTGQTIAIVGETNIHITDIENFRSLFGLPAKVANASALADTLSRERDRALLFRTLATLRTDIVLFDDVDELRWNGPTLAFTDLAARLDAAVTETRRPAPRRSPGAPIVGSAGRR
jgi:hypothetical protein